MIFLLFFLKEKWEKEGKGKEGIGGFKRRKSVLDSIETIVFLYRYHP